MPRQRKTPPLLDDGMPEAERRALDAALNEAINELKRGEGTTSRDEFERLLRLEIDTLRAQTHAA